MGESSRQPWAWILLIVGAGLLLRWPAVHSGFHMDDYAQLAMLRGEYPAPRSAWDLYSFTKGASENALLISRGSLPWWADPQLRLTALRPLASVLLWVDARVLGHDPVAMHVHSLAWWVAMIVAAFAALRRHASTTVALVALAIYALDDAHTYPVTWIANRAALVSATFGFVALWSHVRWCEDDWRAGRLVAVGSSVLALAAGEYGLCAVAFIVGYELRADGPWSKRLRRLLPIATVVLAYLVVHRIGGFGSEYSGVYVDPAREPFAFAAAVARRLPVLAADVLLAVPLSTALQHPAVSQRAGLIAAGLLAPVVILLYRARRRMPSKEGRRLDGWALGAVLGLLPVSASFLSGRLTVVAALAGHLWIAAWLVQAWSHARSTEGRRRWIPTLLPSALVALHLLGAPWWGRAELGGIADFNRGGRQAALSWSNAPHEVPPSRQRIVVLTVTDPMMLIYPPWIRWSQGHPLPRSWWVLSMAPHVHRLFRVADDAIELSVVDGAMLRGPVEVLFRDPRRRPAVGESVDLDGLRIEILETAADGAPTRVRYTFDVPLEDPSLAFAIVSPRGLLRYPIGPIGSTVTVAPGTHPLTLSRVPATTRAGR